MSGWLNVILVGAIVLNVGTITWNLVTMWRQHRYLVHLRVVDRLLTNICVGAFHMRHEPIFRAWSQSMGSIKVEVTAERKRWTD